MADAPYDTVYTGEARRDLEAILDLLLGLDSPSVAADKAIAAVVERGRPPGFAPVGTGKRFTHSMDDAITLAPHPMGSMSVATFFNISARADLFRGRCVVYFDPGMGGGPQSPGSVGDTGGGVALAICIACIKARLGIHDQPLEG